MHNIILEKECLAKKAELEKLIADTRVRIANLQRRLATTSSIEEKQNIEHNIIREERSLAGDTLKLKALPCVHGHSDDLIPRGDDCQVKKAALERKMAATRIRIDQLRRRIASAKTENDKQKIRHQVEVELLNIVGDDKKLNALPCAHSGGGKPKPKPGDDCQVKKAALEREIAKENLRIHELQDQLNQIPLIKGAESETNKLLGQIKSENGKLAALQRRVSALPCVQSGML
jgi:hypothetical protein